MAVPRKPPPPVTSTLPRPVHAHDSLLAAQTASFSRKILALWRMSTGNAGWNRIVRMPGCAAKPAPSSSSSLRTRSVSVGSRQRPARGSTQITGIDLAAAACTPTRAVRNTSGWVLKIASQGMVNSVSSAQRRPGATSARRTRAARARRDSRRRPCGARTHPSRRSAILASAVASGRLKYVAGHDRPLHDDLADLRRPGPAVRRTRSGSARR